MKRQGSIGRRNTKPISAANLAALILQFNASLAVAGMKFYSMNAHPTLLNKVLYGGLVVFLVVLFIVAAIAAVRTADSIPEKRAGAITGR